MSGCREKPEECGALRWRWGTSGGCTGARPGDVEEENEREIGRSDFLRIHAQGAVARVAVWGLIVC